MNVTKIGAFVALGELGRQGKLTLKEAAVLDIRKGKGASPFRRVENLRHVKF